MEPGSADSRDRLVSRGIPRLQTCAVDQSSLLPDADRRGVQYIFSRFAIIPSENKFCSAFGIKEVGYGMIGADVHT